MMLYYTLAVFLKNKAEAAFIKEDRQCQLINRLK